MRSVGRDEVVLTEMWDRVRALEVLEAMRVDGLVQRGPLDALGQPTWFVNPAIERSFDDRFHDIDQFEDEE